MKDRSPDQAVISISLPKELLARIDARAASLNMPRSRYLTFLAKSDIERGGALVIAPTGTLDDPPEGADSAAEMARFLELAVPALAEYQGRKDSPGAGEGARLELPESLAENQFWLGFLDERDEILRLKWIESQKAGRDIGFKQAIQLWLKHRPGWRAAYAAAST